MTVPSTGFNSHTHPHNHAHNQPISQVLVRYDAKHVPRSSIPNDPFAENVVNLLPVELSEAPKKDRYKSSFAPLAKAEYWSGRKQAASIGPAAVPKEVPNRFLKKGDGLKKVEPAKKAPIKASREHLRPPVPTAKEAAIRAANAQKGNKNFIKLNALETIHAEPKDVNRQGSRYVAKKDYGRVPEYLSKRKEEFSQAKHNAERREMERQKEEILKSGLIPLPEEERLRILEGLKANWEKLNAEYMKMSLVVDTVPKINKKVNLENGLKRLEQDIKQFSNTNILVDFHSMERHR